jgi:Zn finger protein HypA/HybF involved in hydrogenase expression
MHESGLIQALLRTALAEAERRDASLIGIDVRLGVLAGGSPEHLREHFEIELARLGLGPITLNIAADPDHPGGVEIVGVELRE